MIVHYQTGLMSYDVFIPEDLNRAVTTMKIYGRRKGSYWPFCGKGHVLVTIHVSLLGATSQCLYKVSTSLPLEDKPFAIIVLLHDYCVFRIPDNDRAMTPKRIP